MLYKASYVLQAATLTAPVLRASSALAKASKCMSLQPAIQRQTRCLSIRLTGAKNAKTLSLKTCTGGVHDVSSYSRAPAIRFASISTSPTPAASESSTLPISQPLTWERYLALRQKRRYYNIIASSLTALGTFAGGLSFLLAQDIEKVSGFMFGLEPFFAVGIVCFGFGAIGWLMGPFAGGLLFRTVHRKVAKSMETVRQISFCPIKQFQASMGILANFYTLCVYRRKGTSIIVLKRIAATLLANQYQIQCQITMAKRSSPLEATGIG